MAKGAMYGEGACVAGGLHGEGACVHSKRDGHCRGRYAFYWNAFLFVPV